ncbi:MAG: hypothetical protein M3463_08125 [Verrucomicrobiota bacterium]|nr:hypothetical protein [Verrucomicrobiota bacterium]
MPWPFEYDLGHNDKRNGRYKLGHPLGNMSVLLRFLESAAKESNHPELAAAPIVGWVGQNGAKLCADLDQRAPGRVLAWGDAWYKEWPKYPDLIARVPVASAWEFKAKERDAERQKIGAVDPSKPTPPPDLRCYATTYGFSHGIYSKWNFFVAFLDRCIALRLPKETPPAGEPVRLRPIDIKAGWAGDYSPVSEWAPIAPYGEAKGMLAPTWMPDAYAAWMWRSYHSANPNIKIISPAKEYKKGGGPECGLGYGGVLKAGATLTFAAESTGDYAKVEFRDGDRIVGVAEAAPWKVEGVKLERPAWPPVPTGPRPTVRPATSIRAVMATRSWMISKTPASCG